MVKYFRFMSMAMLATALSVGTVMAAEPDNVGKALDIAASGGQSVANGADRVMTSIENGGTALLDAAKTGATVLASVVSGIVSDYGPAAIELARGSARIAALHELMPGIAGGILFVVFLVVFTKAFARNNTYPPFEPKEPPLSDELKVLLKSGGSYAGREIYEKMFGQYQKDYDARREYVTTVNGITMALSVAGAIIAFVVALLHLFNAWAWAGLFVPEIYMVRMALDAIQK